MKIVFMGTPEFGVPILEALIEKYDVCLVVTQPDKEVGRNKEIRFSKIKECALKHNIEVFQPEKIRKEYQKVLDVNPDIVITCAFGQMIPDIILEYPKYGAINVHASLLPKFRGGSPIHKSITSGEKETGITIMYMVKKMDAGDIITQRSIPILDSDNLGTIHDKLQIVGKELLMDTLPLIFTGNINPIKQDEEKVTFAYNITREEEKINFNQFSRSIFNHVRGFNPYPVAYGKLDNADIKMFKVSLTKETSTLEPGTISKIVSGKPYVATLDYDIILEEIQYPGKKRMLIKDFMNGMGKKVFEEGKKFE